MARTLSRSCLQRYGGRPRVAIAGIVRCTPVWKFETERIMTAFIVATSFVFLSILKLIVEPRRPAQNP